MNRCDPAVLAEVGWHHPELILTYPWLMVCLQTHDAGGVTDKDFELAWRIEELATWVLSEARAGGSTQALDEKKADSRSLSDFGSLIDLSIGRQVAGIGRVPLPKVSAAVAGVPAGRLSLQRIAPAGARMRRHAWVAPAAIDDDVRASRVAQDSLVARVAPENATLHRAFLKTSGK